MTQLNESMAFLKKHLNVRSEIRGLNRHDIYEIPIDALREAMVNALVHRDYGIKGTSLYVRVFDDRIEIENPGGLPDGLLKKDFGKSSVRRNPIIADLFHRMDKVEEIGSGIDRMRNLLRDANLKEPVFEMTTFFRTIFYRDPEYALKGEVEDIARERTRVKTRGKTRDKILGLLRQNSQLTVDEMADILEITIKDVEWQIKKLKDEGLLKRVGSRKEGYWEVV